MLFDFGRFSKIAARVYPGGAYTLEECLQVFKCYFAEYERFMGKPHPPIRSSQIIHIMQKMPWIEEADKGSMYSDVDTESYRYMIHQHFKTAYRNCDYNINHFFSGRIRELRFYETCY